MFERLRSHIEWMARRRADVRAAGLAERMRDTLPARIGTESIEGGVRLYGRGLVRRLLLDPALRWTIIGESRDGRGGFP
jgi:hypothetical protein